MVTRTSEQDHLRVLDDQGFLESRGVVLGPTDYTTRQLLVELSRRGWRWQFDAKRAEATKAYPPSGAAKHTIVADDSDPVANLAKVLVEAIQFDEARGLTPPDPIQADIELRAPNGHVVALVEVKNSKGLTRDVVTAWRRNLFLHGLQNQDAPYFLIVSQDTGHLWDQRQDPSLDAPPTVSFSMQPVVVRFAPWLAPGERLGGQSLEIVVSSWLSNLAEQDHAKGRSPEESLAKTGFLDAIRHAAVSFDDLP